MGQYGNLQSRKLQSLAIVAAKGRCDNGLRAQNVSRVSSFRFALLARAFVEFLEPGGGGRGKTQLLEPIRISDRPDAAARGGRRRRSRTRLHSSAQSRPPLIRNTPVRHL